MKEKTWVSGSLSPYQLHDITHRPDWEISLFGMPISTI